MAWWRRAIQVWPFLCFSGLTSPYLGEPHFLPAGSGTDLPGVAGEGRTPGRRQACWRCAVKDRGRCQPERREKSSHESAGHRARGRECWGTGGWKMSRKMQGTQEATLQPHLMELSTPAPLARSTGAALDALGSGPAEAPGCSSAAPPGIDGCSAATVGSRQDRYTNQHRTEPPALFPTPNFVVGGAGGG